VRPPAAWSIALDTAAAGLGAAAAAIFVLWRRRAAPSALADPRARRSYWKILGIEAAAIAGGAGGLAAAGESSYIAAWVLLVVGVHFLPLARVFQIHALLPAGLLLIPGAAAAAAIGAAGGNPPSRVAGTIGGLVCLGCAAYVLCRAWTAE
jgi:hypothetical protein